MPGHSFPLPLIPGNDVAGVVHAIGSAVDGVDFSAAETLRSIFGILEEKGVRLVVAQVMEDYSAQAMGVVNKRLDVLTTVATAAPEPLEEPPGALATPQGLTQSPWQF